jgi:hypothetical protein
MENNESNVIETPPTPTTPAGEDSVDCLVGQLLWNEVRCMCGNVFNAHACPVCECPLDELIDDRKERPNYQTEKAKYES